MTAGEPGAVPERGGIPGPAFYDDDAVFATYTAHRHRAGNPNDALEGPAFLAMLGSVAGLRVVDLGCGDGGFGRALLDAGCAAYTGVDGSRRMCAAARRALDGTAGRVVEQTIEAWDPAPGAWRYPLPQGHAGTGIHPFLSCGPSPKPTPHPRVGWQRIVLREPRPCPFAPLVFCSMIARR